MSGDASITELTTRAYGCRLERRDGITLGFTSHDRDVEIDGIIYLASPGMEPSSIVQSAGLEPGGLDVRGALSSSAIREEDLHAGKWNRARVEIFLFDWEQPDAVRYILASGELGSISYSEEAFEAELLGLADMLGAPAVPATSPGCRATFCDNDCGLSRHRFEHAVAISGMADGTVTLSSTSPVADGDLRYGMLRFLSGPNTGLHYNITKNSGSNIDLTEAVAFSDDNAVKIMLIEGCDKTLETCQSRFGNAVNFRGEPFLPGNDLLTRYPGAN